MRNKGFSMGLEHEGRSHTPPRPRPHIASELFDMSRTRGNRAREFDYEAREQARHLFPHLRNRVLTLGS